MNTILRVLAFKLTYGHLVPCVLVLWAAAVAAPLFADNGIWLLDHDRPEGRDCGGWGSISYRACTPMQRCHPDTVSAETSLALYDRIDVEIDRNVAEACSALQCRSGESRNDHNHFECVGPGTLCMNRSLAYHCREGQAARTRPSQPGAVRSMAIDQAALGQVMAAQVQPADLALDDRFRIGDMEVPWGQTVQLGQDNALSPDDAHCRFRFGYTAVNLGEGQAGLHVNRIRIGDDLVVAEDQQDSLSAGAKRATSGTVPLWTGEHILYVHLDAEEQVRDSDRSNNIRRIRTVVAEGCADPRPQARAPREGSAQHIPRPTGRHAPPQPQDQPSRPQARPPGEGSTRHIPRPTGRPAPPRSGTRAAPPQGKPAPGTSSKPVPADAGDCKPMLSVTRHIGATVTGARATAIAAWEASAWSLHGADFLSWEAARDKDSDCSLNFGWSCTVQARPCRN